MPAPSSCGLVWAITSPWATIVVDARQAGVDTQAATTPPDQPWETNSMPPTSRICELGVPLCTGRGPVVVYGTSFIACEVCPASVEAILIVPGGGFFAAISLWQ